MLVAEAFAVLWSLKNVVFPARAEYTEHWKLSRQPHKKKKPVNFVRVSTLFRCSEGRL